MEELVSFNVAKLAKEKGYFNGGLKYHYDYAGKFGQVIISAPTQSLLQRWLREEHNIEVTVDRSMNGNSLEKYYYSVSEWIDENTMNGLPSAYSNTFETTLDSGLFEGLKLIKDKLK